MKTLRRAMHICLLSVSLTLSPVIQSDGKEPSLVITNARVIVGNGEVKDDATVVIHGQRIESVLDRRPSVKAVQRIDAGGKTVMPGLIDTHVHLMSWVAGEGEEATRRFLATEVPKNLRLLLQSGVTTVKSVGDPADLVLSLRDHVADAVLPGPRLLVVGPVFTSVGGHPVELFCKGNQWCRKQFCVEVDDCESARREVCSLAEKKVDAIKILYDDLEYGGVAATKLKKDVLQCIVQEAHRNHLRATVHTPLEQDAIDAMEAGADGLEHGVTRFPLESERLANLMKRNGSFYVPTLAVLESSMKAGNVRREHFVAAKNNLQVLQKRGVKIALGSDTSKSVAAAEGTLRELELMADAGLSPAAIIEAATRNAAEHLGLADEVGTIEQGKIADLIIVDGDPLTDISTLRKIVTVVQSGRVVHDSAAD